jgi:hypothetical protein
MHHGGVMCNTLKETAAASRPQPGLVQTPDSSRNIKQWPKVFYSLM